MPTTKLYLHNLDLSQNQLINPVLHNATSDPSTPVDGQLYYNTTTKKIFFYNGQLSLWKEVGAAIVGTNNYLPKFSGETLVNSLIYDDGTSVGIGTSSLTSGYRLNIAGRVLIVNNTNSPGVQIEGQVEASTAIENLDITGSASGLLNGYVVNTLGGASSGAGWRFGNNIGLKAQIFVGSGIYTFGANRFFIDVLSNSDLEIGSRGGNIDFNSGSVGISNTKIRMYNNGTFVIGNVATVDTAAILNVNSTTKGVLLPRMTQANRTLISEAPAGLLVYQTDGQEGLYEKVSSGWRLINQATSTSPTAVERYSDTKTATANQTVFISSYSFLGGVVDVFLNGSKLVAEEYTITDNTTITLTSPARLNDVIEILILKSAISLLGPTTNTVTTNYTLTMLDSLVLADTTLNDIAISLPLASTANQKGYNIKNIGTKILAILPYTGETIDGQTSWMISGTQSSLNIIPYNNKWYII